jgi:hypothetical protein
VSSIGARQVAAGDERDPLSVAANARSLLASVVCDCVRDRVRYLSETIYLIVKKDLGIAVRVTTSEIAV